MSALGSRARRARDRARAVLPAGEAAQPAARPSQLLAEQPQPSFTARREIAQTGPMMAITAGAPRTPTGPQQAAVSGPQPVLPPPSRAVTGPQPAQPVRSPQGRRPPWTGPQPAAGQDQADAWAAHRAARTAWVAGHFASRRDWFSADMRSTGGGGLPLFPAVVATHGRCGLDQVQVPDDPQEWTAIKLGWDASADLYNAETDAAMEAAARQLDGWRESEPWTPPADTESAPAQMQAGVTS